MTNEYLNLEKRSIFPERYALSRNGAYSDGKIDEIFHPQARFTSIDRIHSTSLQVRGSRPRAFNLGVRKFIISIVPALESTIENDKLLIDHLQTYLSRY